MKARLLGISLIALAAVWLCSAVAQPTGKPQDNNLTPGTTTFYVNMPPETTPPDNVNNGRVESLGVAIADNGNILIGWEDDGDALTDLEAVWTMYNATGTAITPDTLITSIDPAYAGQTITSRFLSYFRGDGSAVSGRTSWGPKIKANLFGPGLGMGASAFDLGLEVTSEAGYITVAGDDWPAVQLLTSSGQPAGIVNGVPEDYGARDGNIRIGDWDFLSNGNIVIVGESRQNADLVDIYQGAAEGRHAIFRIVDKTGKEVKPVTLVSETLTAGEIWHGVGVTKDGFAVRWSGPGGANVRMFKNDGTPTTGNLELGTLTGQAITAGGGRGDSVGFHGNGKDAYVAIDRGTVDGTNQVWVTVLSTNGTVRFSKPVSTDYANTKISRLDAAIDLKGRVFAVWGDQTQPEIAGVQPAIGYILGRVLDATGEPIGGTFFVSEKDEETAAAYYESTDPRVTVQGDAFAVVWESKNAGAFDPISGEAIAVVAARLFGITFEPGSIEAEGMTRIVPDTVINRPDSRDKLGNWEPYSSVLGNSVFLIEGNTFATNTWGSTWDKQNWVVQLQPVEGGAPKLMQMFYTDAGQPYADDINLSRQNGNPGRVAGDKRPGATNFIVGAEISPHGYPDLFDTDHRFANGVVRDNPNARYGCVQTYKLDVATLVPTPLSKVQDSALGRLTPASTALGDQETRFGGELAGLDNGNFVSVVEDRSKITRPDGNCGMATIFAPDGTVVKEAFKIADGDIWSNACSHKGGWAARMNGIIYFYDNEGNLRGQVDQAICGRSFDRGRGDGVRLQGHINSPYVFLTGKTGTGLVSLACFDSRDFSFVAVNDVSEPGFEQTADRVGLAVDALNRVVVSWVSQPAGYEAQQVAARVMALNETAKTITPLTRSFLPFINAAKTGGIRTLQMNPAMTTKQIMIAAKGEINLQNKPELGAEINPDTGAPQSEMNFYTVFTHPAPAEDPTPPVGAVTRPTISISMVGGKPTVVFTGKLQSAAQVTGPYAEVAGAASPYTVTAPGYFRAVK